MKKAISCLIVLSFLVAMLPLNTVSAGSLPTCSISTWRVLYNGSWVSGGCTCHVAERVRAVTGKLVPNWGNAGLWWGKAISKNTDEPRVGAIAGFSYGHVAYVEGVKKTRQSTPVVVRTASYTSNWVKYSVTLYKVTETYTVTLSHKDFSRIKLGDNSIRYTSFQSSLDRYYWGTAKIIGIDRVRSTSFPTKPGNRWTTPRSGSANYLQGFIYP